MTTLSMQQIFDKVVTHLLTQNAKSVDNMNDCLYRNEQGLRCAVGCLIADEHYTPDLEGHYSGSGVVSFALEKSGVEITPQVDKLLSALQSIHDNSEVEYWGSDLQAVAQIHYLEYKGV